MSLDAEPNGPTDLNTVRELAAVGRYDEVGVVLLKNKSDNCETRAPGEAALVLAAGQLCASGAQCRAEAELHARACAAAVSREREVRRHLDGVLRALTGGEPPDPGTSAGEPRKGEGADLVAFCLGPFRLYQRGVPVVGWNGSKCQSVLRYLLLHRRRRVPKEVLMEAIWPGSGADAARRNLHQAVYSLRQGLRRGGEGGRHVRFADDCYFLDPDLSVWLDYEEFERTVDRGELLERAGRSSEAAAELIDAERLYGGDLFEDRPYDEWAMAERERLRALRHRVVSALSDRHAERGEHRAAVELCQKLLAEDPCDEASHRRLIACHLAQGRRDLAAHQLRTCEEILRAELGVEPSPELESLRSRLGP